MSAPEIIDNTDKSRFEAHVGGTLAGFLDYRLGEGTIDMPHTVVKDEYEGQGVGSALVRAALDAVRADGELKVIPTCPFVKGYIDKHPDYADLLA